ncbi:MAG: nucleotide exchange factor GrpE [Dehalococcoidia bacterium]
MSVREDEERPAMNDRRASSQPEGESGAASSPAGEGAGSLEEEREKAATYLSNWQRTAADFANYKRRVEQEREEWARLSNASLVMNVLPLFDDLERALDNVDANIAGLTWLEGIRLIQRKFKQFLEGNGVEEIQADGESFDPNVHEAVMFGEGPEGKVIGVVQKGYKLGNRVLRPTMVVVGQGGKQETTS